MSEVPDVQVNCQAVIVTNTLQANAFAGSDRATILKSNGMATEAREQCSLKNKLHADKEESVGKIERHGTVPPYFTQYRGFRGVQYRGDE